MGSYSPSRVSARGRSLWWATLLSALVFVCAGCGRLPLLRRSDSPPSASTTREPSRKASDTHVNAPGPASPAVAIDRNAQVVVLGYHRFVEKVNHPDTEITPADFEAQMNALKEQQIAVISLADFSAWRRGEKNIPAQCAIITIDDGYKSGYSVAWPILKKFGFPFTLFIYTDYVKGGPKSGGESLTWAELAEMRDAGVSIQSHTLSHRDLRGKKSHRGEVAYEQWLWKELSDSKAIIQNQLGIKVTALALPYGASNPRVREVATKAGYEMVFSVEGQKLGYNTEGDRLGRYIIESNKPQLFTTAVTFKENPASAPAAEMAALELKAQPADQQTIQNATPRIEANLAAMGAIEPESAAMRLSGFGAVPAQYDPRSKSLVYQPTENLPPDHYTVIVSAKSGGRKYEARWKFTVEAKQESPMAKSPP